MLGPQGSGKGTQAKILANKYNLPHISTGEIFRENLKNKTKLGELAGDYIQTFALTAGFSVKWRTIENQLNFCA